VFDSGRAVRQQGEHGESAGGRRIVGAGQRRGEEARRRASASPRTTDIEREVRRRALPVAPISTNLILAYRSRSTCWVLPEGVLKGLA